jgi:hypothetical protein
LRDDLNSFLGEHGSYSGDGRDDGGDDERAAASEAASHAVEATATAKEAAGAAAEAATAVANAIGGDAIGGDATAGDATAGIHDKEVLERDDYEYYYHNYYNYNSASLKALEEEPMGSRSSGFSGTASNQRIVHGIVGVALIACAAAVGVMVATRRRYTNAAVEGIDLPLTPASVTYSSGLI